MLKYPDYHNSILNLINSIEKNYGVHNDYPTLGTADIILEAGYRNIVVMVFDAMGSSILQRHLPEDSFLRKHMLKEISSVFPPTTTAAVSTLQSGLAPAEHSWLGWSLHFPEVNDNVNVFINTNDNGEKVADYPVADRYIPYESVFDKINQLPDVRAESISAFGSYHTDSLEEILEGVETLCREEGRHYLYTYWHEPDYSMHMNGVASEAASAWVSRIDAEIETLSCKLQDTVLFIIADHGHMDSRNECICDYPDLLDTLKWLPTIEPRAVNFHIKEGREQEFQDAFLKHFQNDFMLLSKQEVIDNKLFGDGKTHPRFEEFLGNYLAVAVNDVSIFNTREETERFVGNHAGLTEAEMMVPLIVIEKK
jgi:hypothetical protein